ncbi:MAG: energy transducer TonB [Fibrobacteraceae bacterium]|nr:energy transducer TonB [Fibrobacteraceae bacterium]
MFRVFLKRFFLIIAATVASFVLVFSVTVANLFIKGGFFKERTYRTTEVRTVPPPQIKDRPKVKEAPRRPKMAKANHRSPKAGPQFAMDLSVADFAGEGAMVPSEFVAKEAGSGSVHSEGDVDEKPSFRGSLPTFDPPRKLRDAEQDAILRLSFCVDKSGRAYNIKAVEESPAGMGLLEAGKASLSRAVFTPAKKAGKPVAFCGMEQPFEIRFRD